MSAQTQEEIIAEKRNWHWRNSMRPARFFALDARAGLPFLIMIVYIRPITIVLTILFTAVFVLLERFGLTFPSALRAFRGWLAGKERPGHYVVHKRRLIDYG